METWIALLEFVAPVGDRPFQVEDLLLLLQELAPWQPEHLWTADRYAVQLRLAARTPQEAVQRALDCYRLARQAVDLAPSKLVRVEAMTADEMERGWHLEDSADSWGTAVPVLQRLDCPEVYTATRALLAATGAVEIAEIVEHFVVTIGARVLTRQPHAETDVTIFALGLEEGPCRYAAVEALSVAGLLLEQFLPTLLADARSVVAKLRRSCLGGGGSDRSKALQATDLAGDGPPGVEK
jgi:hypothetical protein